AAAAPPPPRRNRREGGTPIHGTIRSCQRLPPRGDSPMFDALYLEKPESGFSARRRQLSDDELVAATPDADVTVRIDYSTLNYKDALALTNRSPVVRRWPMVPGIDGAGVVEASTHPGFAAGDAVVLNGWGVGEAHWGCLAQRARLKGDWLIA